VSPYPSGGALLIGVEDGTKAVDGFPDVLKEEERPANLIADNISPKLVPSIEVIACLKAHVLGVEIYPSSIRSHHLNRPGAGRGCFRSPRLDEPTPRFSSD
jgi:ATP-dependent DNA helicase RecG